MEAGGSMEKAKTHNHTSIHIDYIKNDSNQLTPWLMAPGGSIENANTQSYKYIQTGTTVENKGKLIIYRLYKNYSNQLTPWLMEPGGSIKNANTQSYIYIYIYI